MKKIFGLVVLSLAVWNLLGCGTMNVNSGSGGDMPAPVGTSITGRVTDFNSVTLSGVTVQILNFGYEKVSTTDATGKFSLNNLATNIVYNLAATKTGYYAQTFSNVDVSEGKTTTQNFKLLSTSQPAGTLIVNAKNLNNVGVSSTFVVTKEGDSEPCTVSVTNDSGYGTIYGLPPSIYLIYVSKASGIGPIAGSAVGTIEANKVTTVEVTLK